MRIERSRLRQHLHHHPADREARAALAANHRTAGHPDQAGRWGLLVPGCSTPAERRAFAAWVARTGEIDRARVLRLLFVPRRAYSRELDPGDELGGIEQMLAQERRLHYVETDTDTGEWLSNTTAGLVGLVVLFGLLGGTASTVIALTGGPGTPPLDTTWASLWSAVSGGSLQSSWSRWASLRPPPSRCACGDADVASPAALRGRLAWRRHSGPLGSDSQAASGLRRSRGCGRGRPAWPARTARAGRRRRARRRHARSCRRGW
jgi:hypothetical protein